MVQGLHIFSALFTVNTKCQNVELTSLQWNFSCHSLFLHSLSGHKCSSEIRITLRTKEKAEVIYCKQHNRRGYYVDKGIALEHNKCK